MGNQLGGDPQTAQIATNVFQQMVNNPQTNQRQDNMIVNPQTQSRFNNRTLSGDKNINNSSTQFIPPMQPYVSPVKQPFNPLASTARSNFNYNSSRVIGQSPTIPTNQTARKQKAQRPFSFFTQIFGGIDQQSSQHVRSNSASSVSMNNSGRKIQLLESNLQLSERKANELQSKINQSEQIQKRYQQRIQFLQEQANMGHQEIQKLRNLLNEKEKYLRQSQVQVRTQKNQIQLQNNRLNQSGIRQQRKDKQIQSLSSAKFQLNSLKIRLQNNIKILEEQIESKTDKIGELDRVITKKNREIENVKHQKNQLQKNIFHLQSEIEKSNTKYQEQKGMLNMTIRSHLHTIDENESRILQLSHKIDKYYHNQLESQAHIGNLETSISENRQFISQLERDKQNLMTDSLKFKQVIQGLNTKLEQQMINSLKSKQVADKAIADFTNAKKVGQKQIQFLQTKIDELSRVKQRLNQEIQMTKAVAIQRNKIFERSIIYDLKQENDRLWAKLISKSNSETDIIPEENSSRKSKPEIKSGRTKYNEAEQKQQMCRSKSQLQVRFQNFIKKLSENGQEATITRDLSINSLQKHNQNTQFYKQKCNELQKMVQSHIVLNKNLKDQLQKYENNQVMLIKWQKQASELRKTKTALTNQNNKLKQQIDLLNPEFQLKEKRLENKVRELEAQNKRLYEDIQKSRKEVQSQRFSSKRSLDEANRQQNQLSSYKKWESLYDDLKKRYDQISLSSKDDYKGMFEDLQSQHERLRQLYGHKQEDLQKLKRMSNQKLQNYEKEKKQRQNNIEEMKKDYEQLEKHFNLGRQQYQKLLIEARKIQNQLFRVKRQNESHALNKQKVNRLIAIFKTRIVQIDSYLSQIKSAYENEINHHEIPEWAAKCQKVLEICSIQCDRVRESN